MSGTRSPSRRGPATEVLIVSHGQPSSPEAGETQLQQLAAQVQLLLPGWVIRSATLAAPGVFERQLAACAGEPFVYPVFMADGWFTKKALPARIGERNVHQLSPLGVHPGLPHRTVKLLKVEAERRGWTLNSCNIMIAAHGSETGPAAADCALYFARRLRGLMPFKKKIHTGFLAQEPYLSLVAQVSTPRTLLLPFLAGTGSHLTDDIPEALEEARFRGVLLPALGEAVFIADLIAHSLKNARLRTENFDPLAQDVCENGIAPSIATQSEDAARVEATVSNEVTACAASSPGPDSDATSAITRLVRRVRDSVLKWNGPSRKRSSRPKKTKSSSHQHTNPTKSQAA